MILSAFWTRLADLQTRFAWVFLVIAAVVSIASLPLISTLGLDSRLIALLPDSQPSVTDLKRVATRMGGLSTLTVVVQSKSRNTEGMQKFVRVLVDELAKHPSSEVGIVDWNVNEYEDFVRQNKHLYAPLGKLVEIKDAIDERIDEEKIKASPFYVDLEDDSEEQEDHLQTLLDDLKKRSDSKAAKYPGGFYQHPEHDMIAVFLRTDASGKDVNVFLARIKKIVAQLKPSSFAPDLSVHYTGDLIIGEEEKSDIAEELTIATSLTTVACVFAIMYFFRSVRSVFLLGAGLVPCVLMTFAFAALSVGSLNTSTAFLSSIVIGNGINPGIIWLARYYEERRKGRAIGDAVRATHLNVWLATIATSGAAAASYGSLAITDFKGFRDFGVIGGFGMLICWVGSVLFLPAAAAFADKIRALVKHTERSTDSIHDTGFSSFAARIMVQFPKQAGVLAVVITLMSIVFVTRAILADPIEYDFRKLRSERLAEHSVATSLNRRVNDIVDKSTKGQGIAILLPSIDELPGIEKQLDRTQGSAHGGYKSLNDLLPKDVEQKKQLLSDIRTQLTDLRPKVDEKTQQTIDENMPPESYPTLTIKDIPAQVARPYSEKNGTRGTILIVQDNPKYSTWDGRYLIRWAKALRALQLSDGSRPPLAGQAPVFADMITAVYKDMPKAIAGSFLAVLSLCFLAFRRWSDRVLAMATLLLGVLWMMGGMAILGMKLNFLNFVAFPISLGIGVDYAINVLRRYRLEKDAGMPNPIYIAVSQSGGAVVLCSLTTVIGYATLLISANKAMNSFGLAMSLGELMCLCSAVIVLPVVLQYSDSKKKKV